MLTLEPLASSPEVKGIINASPAILDRTSGHYVLRPADFPGLVTSAIRAGVELVPTTSLAPALREAAEEARRVDAFIAEHGGDLYPFQRDGVGFLHRRRHAFLLDEMGLGKTVQALHAIEPGGASMVVCPAFLRRNWRREAERWRRDIEPIEISKRDDFRYPRANELVIVSYAGLPENPDQKSFGKVATGTALIADEAQAVKRAKSNRTRNFRKMSRRIHKQDGYVWMLTGTPVENNPNELWTLLQAQSVGRRGLGTVLYEKRERFVKLFGGFVDSLGQAHWGGEIAPDAMAPLEGYVLRRKRSEVLGDLPPKLYADFHVEAPKHAPHLWDDVAEQALAESYDYWGGIDGMPESRKALASAKIPALRHLVDSYRHDNTPVVVFSVHRAPIEAMEELPRWGIIHGKISDDQRDATVAAFQAGELDGLACTVQSAGTGFTMTRAAHAIFVDQHFNPAKNKQAEDRLVRIGQDRAVTITRIVIDHKLDRLIAAALRKKMRIINATTETITNRAPRNDAEELDRLAALIDSAV